MHKFKIGEYVKVTFGNEEIVGEVILVSEETIDILMIDGGRMTDIPIAEAIFLPKSYMSPEQFQVYARYELPVEGDVAIGNIENLNELEITILDLKEAISNFLDKDEPYSEFIQNYFRHFMAKLNQQYNELDQSIELGSAHQTFGYVLNSLIGGSNLYIKEEMDDNECLVMMRDLEKYLDTYLTNLPLPFEERIFSVEEMEKYAVRACQPDALKSLSETDLDHYRLIINRLADMHNPVGLDIRAYAYYCGGTAFPQDFFKAAEDLKYIYDNFDNNDSYRAANALGYIYYYGRLNKGEPDYQQAYQYFSHAAFNGNFESIMKIGDMYHHGLIVKKSLQTCRQLTHFVYDQTLNNFARGEHNNEFADAALRMGTLALEQIEKDTNCFEAYYYLSQARYAIKLRMIEYPTFFGDEVVNQKIEEAYKKVIEYPNTFNTEYLYNSTFESIFAGNDLKRCPINVSVKYHFNKTTLTFKPSKIKDPDAVQPRIFLTIPEVNFVGMVDSFTLNVESSNNEGKDRHFSFDDVEDNTLYFDGVPFFIVHENEKLNFEASHPDKKSLECHRFAGVNALSNPQFIHNFLIDDMPECYKGYVFSIEIDGKDIDMVVRDIFELTDSQMVISPKLCQKLTTVLK